MMGPRGVQAPCDLMNAPIQDWPPELLRAIHMVLRKNPGDNILEQRPIKIENEGQGFEKKNSGTPHAGGVWGASICGVQRCERYWYDAICATHIMGCAEGETAGYPGAA